MFRVALYVSNIKMNTVENLNFKDFFSLRVYEFERFKLNLLFDKTVVGAKPLTNLYYTNNFYFTFEAIL